MGLDMYLYAERTLEGEAAATLTKQVIDLGLDAWDEPDGSKIYDIGVWSFMNDDSKAKGLAIQEATSMQVFHTSDTGSAHVRVRPDGTIDVQVACCYWRKANSVHAWFVDNCQNGIDECQYSDPISYEQLAHLVALAKEDITNIASGQVTNLQLPPRSGSFFGSTEVGEWLIEDLKHTVQRIEEVVRIAIEHPAPIQFRYHSSW